MNKEIREFLIDQCVLGVPIYYEDISKKLNLNLELDSDRSVLSKTLGDISTYEYRKGRPLISSIVIYKIENDHGKGFYNLCEKLGIGKSNKLKKEFYGFTEIEKSKKFWKNEFNYSQFYDLKIYTYNDSDNPFFNKDEVDFFKKKIDTVYDKTNPDHFSSKEFLLNTVWSKTKFWSNEIVERLEAYEVSNRMAWSKRGWDNGKKVSVFKPYTWARIFKKGEKGKEIFFTVGVDPMTDSLIYKLDFYHEKDSKLSTEQKKLCNKYIPKNLRWNEIKIDDLGDWDWEKLIQKSVEFISENSHHYDQILELVWGNQSLDNVFTDNLTLRSYPEGGLKELPKMNPKFTGKNVNFLKKNKENKQLGDLGEELVMYYEINKLKQKGLHKFIEGVRIAKDGEGYDIYSFDENGNEVFIEVKTTIGNEKTPFYLSLNERLFYERNSENYLIYRLYNYDFEKNYADFFVIRDLDKQLLFQPTEFKVYVKHKK